MPASSIVCYAPIRRPTDALSHEWIDTGCMGGLPDDCRIAVDHLAEKIPQWHAMNPVIRIAEIRIEEIVPMMPVAR